MSRLCRIVLTVIVTLIAGVVGSAAPLALASAGIGGQVFYQETGSGIAGTVLCLGVVDPNDDYICQERTETGADGFYFFPDVPEGEWLIRVDSVPSPVTVSDLVPSRRSVTVGTDPIPSQTFYVPDALSWSGTKAVAHRGDRVTSPENTYPAFERTIEKGGDAVFVETDAVLGYDGRVIVAHGSNYLDENNNELPTQVYGPTALCHGRNLESDSQIVDLIANCDIGTEMMILPEVTMGDTWLPVFKEERFPLLETVLKRLGSHCKWMIELKKSEHPTADEVERNRQLGRAVQDVIERTGILDRCPGNVWVTSFEDEALDAVTNPKILKMRQVSVLNPVDSWPAQVDSAIMHGYHALNVDLAVMDDTIYADGGPLVPDYIRSKGLLVSSYTLTGAVVLTPPDQLPEHNQTAIDRRADFFMTDILDDLLVRNGTRAEAHTPQTVRLQPTLTNPECRGVFQNYEVFPTKVNVTFYTTSGTILGTRVYNAPALGKVDLEFLQQGAVKATYTYPTYVEPSFDPVYQTKEEVVPVSSTLISIYQSGNLWIKTTAEHTSYSNVEPRFTLGAACGDDVSFYANELHFPSLDGRDRAVVGTNCVGPNDPKIAKNIQLSTRIATKPDNQWTIENAAFYVDNELLGEASGSSPLTLPSSGPVSRDLPPGEHVFKVTYTARNGELTRTVTREEPFTVAIKEPDPETGQCLGTGDVQVTLIWGSYADLDLYVTDPAGETIFYGRTTSSSGGMLDVDANAGCSSNVTTAPVENVYWPIGTAPEGTYRVRVDVWSTCGAPTEPFTLRIRVGDQTKTLTNVYDTTFAFPATQE